MADDLTLSPVSTVRTDRTTKFWDRVAPGYAKKPVADEASYQRKLATTREYLRPDMSILEVGCGTGGTAITHAPLVRRVRATDISPQMLEIAKGRAREAGVANIDFECAALDDLDVPNRSVDVVLALSLLHLLPNWRDAIARVHDMLILGGVFVSSTTCMSDAAPFLRPLAPLGRVLGFLPPLSFFDRTGLEAAILGAGFRIEHAWQPSRRRATFIVARKQETRA